MARGQPGRLAPASGGDRVSSNASHDYIDLHQIHCFDAHEPRGLRSERRRSVRAGTVATSAARPGGVADREGAGDPGRSAPRALPLHAVALTPVGELGGNDPLLVDREAGPARLEPARRRLSPEVHARQRPAGWRATFDFPPSTVRFAIVDPLGTIARDDAPPRSPRWLLQDVATSVIIGAKAAAARRQPSRSSDARADQLAALDAASNLAPEYRVDGRCRRSPSGEERRWQDCSLFTWFSWCARLGNGDGVCRQPPA